MSRLTPAGPPRLATGVEVHANGVLQQDGAAMTGKSGRRFVQRDLDGRRGIGRRFGSRAWPAIPGLVLALAVVGCGSPSASPSSTAGAAPSATATPTALPTPTSAPTPTPTPTPTPAPTAGPAFALTGAMGIPRSGQTATLLPNGRVLIAGGTTISSSGDTSVTATAEIYDPATGAFTSTGSMKAARTGQTATLLKNGRVLLTGGVGSSSKPLASAELFDPATGAFALTGSMTTVRSLHTASLLSDGRVLVVGGGASGFLNPALSSTEIYDPATGLFTAAAKLKKARMDHTATTLADGRILIAGGWSGGTALVAAAEIYDPATGAFALTGPLHTARAGQTATLLSGGRVLIAGGNNATDVGSGVGELASAELYDPTSGTFAATGSMATPRGYHTAVLLADGRVAVVGGFKEPPYGPFDARSYFTTTEVYSPATGKFSAGPAMKQRRRDHTATLLPNGKILVTGGECYQVVAGHMGPIPWKSAELAHI